MSILRKEADALRASAARLEAAAADAPRSAQDLIRRFGPAVLNVENTLELDFVGQADFDAKKCLVRQSAQQLATHIAEKLNLEHVGVSEKYTFPPLELQNRRAIYRAQVYVLTSAELKALVEKVLRAGRESA